MPLLSCRVVSFRVMSCGVVQCRAVSCVVSCRAATVLLWNVCSVPTSGLNADQRESWLPFARDYKRAAQPSHEHQFSDGPYAGGGGGAARAVVGPIDGSAQGIMWKYADPRWPCCVYKTFEVG